jgi:NADH dehydrogenase
MRILITGGTGFIGRHLIARLGAAGHEVQVATRSYARARDILVVPTATVLEADVNDDADVERLVAGCDAVVNLVGILHGDRGDPYGARFARAHVALPRRLAQACVRHGVRRFIHVSAIGADSHGPSMYLRSKGDGEAAIRQAYAEALAMPRTPSAPPARTHVDATPGDWVIFRPSVVFGPEDKFTNMFARLARWLPFLPLAGARTRMQPVYVGDVTAAITAALAYPHAGGRVYELGGPQVHTLGEIASLCARWSGHPRHVVDLPVGVARMQAGMMALLPGEPLLSTDNLDSLSVDNVAHEPMAPELQRVPTPMEAVVPGYLRPGAERTQIIQ